MPKSIANKHLWHIAAEHLTRFAIDGEAEHPRVGMSIELLSPVTEGVRSVLLYGRGTAEQ